MLDPLFKPRAVAIVGASTKELSIGNVIIKNLQRFGYKGKIYPIHPSAPEVRGLKAYKSLADVPGDVDLAHIIIPSRQVPQVIEECGRKGIGAAVINSAGFSEMGPEGASLQKEFLANARKYGVRIFGPNCQGIINTDPALRAYCNFTFTFPEPGAISAAHSQNRSGSFHRGRTKSRPAASATTSAAAATPARREAAGLAAVDSVTQAAIAATAKNDGM